MALDALFTFECVLAVVAETAGLSFIHVSHGCLQFPGLERECLGVAVNALVHAEVEVMAELCLSCIGLEEDVSRLVALVAFVAVTGNSKGILAIVAGSAGFAALHGVHGCFK